MVHTNEATTNLCSAKVVDCQIGAPLILIFEPSKALRLARLFVANEFEKDRLPKLGENCYDIAFG